MSKLIGGLFVLCLVVGAVWMAMNQNERRNYLGALERDGFTEVRLTGEFVRPGKRFPVMGFEAIDKRGVRVTGYVANEQGGIVRARPSTGIAH